MSYPEEARFAFHDDVNTDRRDRDAAPRVLSLGTNPDGDRIRLHVAGDESVISAHVFDAAVDRALVREMEPRDALQLGIAYERARQQEKTARNEP